MQHHRYRRIVAPALGVPLLTATFAPGVAAATTTQPQAPRFATAICDYQPESGDRTSQQSPIDERYNSDAQLREALGEPTGEEQVDNGTRWRAYEGGRLYWTENTGVHAVFGDILANYLQGGGHNEYGVPMTDECETAQQNGRYNHFTGDSSGRVSIYWRADLGANRIEGPVRQHWESSGWEQGTYGFPTSNTTSIPQIGGQFNNFEGDDNQGAAVYWSQNSGTHGVKGAILQHWRGEGGVKSQLGFPTSDEMDKPYGKRSNFQGGYVTWNSDTGETEHHLW